MKKLVSILLVIAMLLPTGLLTVTSSAATIIPSDAVLYNGHYYKIYGESVSWNTAVSNCETLGGHLATITSAGENALIASLISSINSTYWIGAEYVNDEWTWITGETWNYTNWADGEPSYYGSLWKHRCVRIDGDCNVSASNGKQYNYNKGEWDACRHFSAIGHSVPLSGYVCEWDVFPREYDFYKDSYNFENYRDIVQFDYFKTMYGNAKGYKLWENQWRQGGLCFGFTYTTAAFYNGLPSVSSVRDLSKSSKINIGSNLLTVSAYIKYAHIYQFSMEFENNSHWSDATTIYNLVKSATKNDKIQVTIGMTKKTGGGHRVLAIGIDGNDILIDDPNYKNNIQRITVNSDGSWSFSGLSGWNSDTCNIRYSMDIYDPFQFIKSLKPLTVNEEFIDNNTIDSISSSFEADILSEDYLLLSVSGEDYNISNTNISEIEREYTENTAAAELNDLYWIAEDSTVKITDISNNSSVELAGNESIIGVTVSDSSQIELTVDEENDILRAALNTTKNNEYSLSVTTFDDDSNAVILTLTGTAAGGEIAATETDNGVQVTGLNEITVTYETADGTGTANADVKDDATVNIVVDDDSNSIDFDWNCSHLCHSENEFIQFIWKIVNFLCRIFGVNQYCDCGMAHW